MWTLRGPLVAFFTNDPEVAQLATGAMAGGGEFSMVQPNGEVLEGRAAGCRVQFTL